MQACLGHQARGSHSLLTRELGYNIHPPLLGHVLRSRTRCSTASAAAAAAAATSTAIRYALQPAATPRWFGFDTETCGGSIFRNEVIAVAAYDLDSGEAYTTLINPALHNPSYVFGAEELHGECNQVDGDKIHWLAPGLTHNCCCCCCCCCCRC
ncbi:hypothetical protein COO60DRAFT_596357 [Scenedesmus sp. NREL 46B-D3]|nr:hypothetical protein COO60DRAFT_596357 [Scenedesmus sp. NREL 46B-D3]